MYIIFFHSHGTNGLVTSPSPDIKSILIELYGTYEYYAAQQNQTHNSNKNEVQMGACGLSDVNSYCMKWVKKKKEKKKQKRFTSRENWPSASWAKENRSQTICETTERGSWTAGWPFWKQFMQSR